MRSTLSVLLCCTFLYPAAAQAPGQDPGRIFIAIVEGDEIVNNIRQRTAREPIVQVEDENHRPIAGAIVIFSTPNQGASALFPNGARSLTVVTDQNGRAVAQGLRPNTTAGRYQINVRATSAGRSATTTITQTNVLGPAAPGATIAGMPAKTFKILAFAAGAALGVAIIAIVRSGKSSSTVTPGTPTVGPPK